MVGVADLTTLNQNWTDLLPVQVEKRLCSIFVPLGGSETKQALMAYFHKRPVIQCF